MPKTKRDDPAELLRLAITGLDEQIAEMQETRAQLAALIDQRSAGLAAETAPPRKRRKLSAEARAKISSAAKARWAREKSESKSPKAKNSGQEGAVKGQSRESPAGPC